MFKFVKIKNIRILKATALWILILAVVTFLVIVEVVFSFLVFSKFEKDKERAIEDIKLNNRSTLLEMNKVLRYLDKYNNPVNKINKDMHSTTSKSKTIDQTQ